MDKGKQPSHADDQNFFDSKQMVTAYRATPGQNKECLLPGLNVTFPPSQDAKLD